jgi:NAD dependent epimerase/dehydratase family enzyme
MADALLLAGQRALPDRAVESGFAYVYGGLDAALADLVA